MNLEGIKRTAWCIKLKFHINGLSIKILNWRWVAMGRVYNRRVWTLFSRTSRKVIEFIFSLSFSCILWLFKKLKMTEIGWIVQEISLKVLEPFMRGFPKIHQKQITAIRFTTIRHFRVLFIYKENRDIPQHCRSNVVV